MVIVETPDAVQHVLNQVAHQPTILIPILSDLQEHPADGNLLALLGVYCCDTQEVFGLPFYHSEAINLPADHVLSYFTHSYFTSDQSTLAYFLPKAALIDIPMMEYLTTGSVTVPDLPLTLSRLQSKYHQFRSTQRILPLVKWMEYVQAYGSTLSGILQAQSKRSLGASGHVFATETVFPVFHEIEKSGLRVDAPLVKHHFDIWAGERVYSRYNLFTTTGRPSCAFGGINFAALNKHDGSRRSFISRFGIQGRLVLIDFESYHLRLIADLIGYQLPDTPVHEYFGKQYFNTDTLSTEQYEESKRRSFVSLYSDTESSIPFFQRVAEYRQEIWTEIQQDGFLAIPNRDIILSHIDNPSPAKVFNYVVQWLETERNMRLLKPLLQRYKAASSKIVLYNYDAILIDYDYNDGKRLLEDTIAGLEQEQGKSRYPVRCYVGHTYGDLKRFR